ncbi:hypothetical protein HMI55_004749 [Coelomomyces lativittatus]|nr:hypothetical protein HMI55_004749 [Coelomomyces lativittatus]
MANGLLNMLERNKKIKLAPEKWQDRDSNLQFDIIITCEERVFAAVYEDLTLSNPLLHDHVAHLINLEIKDNHEAAATGAHLMAFLATQLEASSDIDASVELTLAEFSKKYPSYSITYSVCFN